VFALGLELDMRVAGVNHEEQRTDVDKAVGGIIGAVRRFDYDWGMVFPDDYIEFEPLGLKMHHPPDGPAIAAEYLPLTRETLRKFRVPDARRELRLPIHLEMIRRLKAALGDTVCIAGRIAAPFSAPAQVALATEALIRENLPGGDYLFNTGEGVMSTTPPENVEAMMRAAKSVMSEMTAPAVG
jgi:uroporphyrinogen-III decarboxylase